MSQLVVNINEIIGSPKSNGSRFRAICQLVELDFSNGITNVVLGNLPEFRQSDEGKTLRAIIGSAAYQSSFDSYEKAPQRGDAVSVWLVVYALEEELNWEVLELKNITTKELDRFRAFWKSQWGHEFRSLSRLSDKDFGDS